MATQWTAGLTSGSTLSANTLNRIGAAWESYTPAWTSTGVAPNLGNGTILGFWARINKTAFVSLFLVMGSTTTYGNGNYRFSLPAGVTMSGAQYTSGIALMYDASAGYTASLGACGRASSTQVDISPIGSNSVTNLLPFTWANADQLRLNLVFQTE